MSEYFASLVTLPIVIVGAGKYRTRSGELVTITAGSLRHDLGCVGTYSDGKTVERWHRSGRLFASRECGNDIVRAA